MRIVNGILAVLLILFVVVQYNDPDGVLWGLIYGVGIIWCGLAALRPAAYGAGAVFGLFAASFIGAIGGLVYYWPKTPRWWMQDVWWETETAREGMGMMILLVALLFAGIVALKVRRA